jgi:hypothetical protein
MFHLTLGTGTLTKSPEGGPGTVYAPPGWEDIPAGGEVSLRLWQGLPDDGCHASPHFRLSLLEFNGIT